MNFLNQKKIKKQRWILITVSLNKLKNKLECKSPQKTRYSWNLG